MTEKEQIIDQFRKDLEKHGVTFLLIHSSANMENGKQETFMTSNSTPGGVQQILAAIWEPTEEAVKLLAQELEAGARASASQGLAVIEQAAQSHAFDSAARLLFSRLQTLYTIRGWVRKSVEEVKLESSN
jgi:hypothetical protein